MDCRHELLFLRRIPKDIMRECSSEEHSFLYNYVIIGAVDDFIRQAYGELLTEKQVYMPAHTCGSKNPLTNALFKLHWSAKVNARRKLPLKKIWFRKMCRHDFHNDKPTCYIFMGGQYIAGCPELREYIYSLNKDNKVVIKYADLIAKKHYRDFERVRNSADLLITYDKDESEKYAITYYGNRTYSRLLEVTEPESFAADVYYIGYAKDRLDTILHVYRKLTQNGLTCRFDLVGVPEEQQQSLPGICYVSKIPYAESLKRLCEAKCVLEISQRGSKSCTMRLPESITYHRLLLTNCDVENSGYYIPDTMFSFHEPENIDIDALKKPIPYSAFREADIHIAPSDFLHFVDAQFNEKEMT